MIDSKKLKALIKYLVFSDKIVNQADFAQQLGYERSTISGMVSGKKPVSESFANKVCEIFDVSIEWMRTGDGQMFKSGETVSATNQEKGMIRYWADVQATGSGITQFEDCDSCRYIDLSIPEFRDCTDAINLYGESMEPRYRSGQIIILKKWAESYIDYGNVYLIITKGGHRMLKVLKSVPENSNQVLCVSYNPAHSPFSIEKEEITNLYLVKGAIEKTTL